MKKHAFKIGIAVYMLLWAALTAAIWYGMWHYAEAYELAQPKGAMTNYMNERLMAEMTDQVAAYSKTSANDFQTEEEIRAYLTETYLDQDWSFRRSSDSTTEAPVYTLYSGDTAVCKAYLTPGEPAELSFGLIPWVVEPVDAGFDLKSRTLTIVSPADCDVTVNGKALGEPVEALPYYPAFAENAADIKVPLELERFTVEGYSLPDPKVAAPEGYDLVQYDENTWYVVVPADEQTQTEMETFAPQFANAYLMFTSNAGSYYTLQAYVAPDSELLGRLYRSLDGMGWVEYTTGRILEQKVENIQYYGNVFTYDAPYKLQLKSGEMEGNMHVVVVRSTYGWRASSFELF